jgi:nucleoid-associated protein YgaU
MRYRSGWTRTAIVGLLLCPGVAKAQVPVAGTQVSVGGPPTAGAPATSHTVKTGDTLWDIARQYLSDPFLWPEVYRLNTAIVEDPHWIFPGEVLALPDPASLGAPIIPVATDEIAPGSMEGPTVFTNTAPTRVTTTTSAGRTQLRLPPPPIREWEYYAAPWVDRAGGPSGAGKIIQAVDLPGIAAEIERDRVQFQDRIYITAPAGATAQRGDRFLTYALGPVLHDLGQVIIPTGIVEVERAGDGEATTVRIVRQFDEIKTDQFVTPMDTLRMPIGGELSPIELGVTARIQWMRNDPVLASIQQYVVLNATARDGIRLGDRFTFLRPRVRLNGDVTLPEEEIAVGQVIRVTDRAVTAIVLSQTHPAIREGTLARLTGRMP